MYDTFSSSNGTATDVSWTLVDDIDRVANWSVEDGMFRSVSQLGLNAIAYPTGLAVKGCVCNYHEMTSQQGK